MHTEKRLCALLAAAIVTLLALSTSPGQVSYAANNAVAVVAPGGVDIGAQFEVSINITAAGDAWAGWAGYLSWNPSILAYVPDAGDPNATPPGVAYTGLGGTVLNETPVLADFNGDTVLNDGIQVGTVKDVGTSTETGTVATVTLRCDAAGMVTLHLVTLTEDTSFGTTLLGPGGVTLGTDLTDAQVNCGGEGPVPTSTPVTGPSPTPGGPAPTPGGPMPTPGGPVATPTPLPPGFEAVDLAAGCNPVATTYANATPIGTIAAAVGPAGSLEALWAMEGATWQGYSPAYPEASDLTAKNFLDVVFVCVRGPGAFVRPIV